MCSGLSIPEAKRHLRQQMRALRDSLSVEDRRERSREIFHHLQSLLPFCEAKLLLFYASFGSEVETREMMSRCQREGKRIALPKVEQDSGDLVAIEISDLIRDLRPGYRGILEPQGSEGRKVEEQELGFILVPGLGFDVKGYRLGYGKGYYDRFLPRFRKRSIPCAGLAFDFQVVEELPVSPGDVPLDWIVTEKRIICAQAGRLIRGRP
ncbi:MAG: 5-formyltetrahydrofolate cyclo-ligase [candidate division NC10 bacterium]|nr:5-formyltetrahydrofolate cyclo-ligase [candidate division NC10 bacterium]